jgi:outer membrane protein assembly factor BamB
VGAAQSNDDSYGYMYVFDAHTGAFLWSYRTGGGVHSSAAVANGVVYFGSDDMNIYALDAGTGLLLWKYATDSAVESSPVVANGMLYVGSGRYMYAFHLLPKR